MSTDPNLYRQLPDDPFTKYSAPGVVYENQNPGTFLEHLIDLHGLDFLCRIIRSATIINQSWMNKELFSAIKNILELNGITKTYLYPSNIAHCGSYYEADKLLENIQLISPALSIITDVCSMHRLPEKVYLTACTDKNELKELIFPSDSRNSSVYSVDFY